MLVLHLNCMTFDGNTPLPFQVHVVQGLIGHIPFRNGVGKLQQTVGQGAFPMVDVCDDAKIADVLHVARSAFPVLRLISARKDR